MKDGKEGDKDSDSDIRQRIYRYIESNPGTHLRKISRELELAMGNTQYHLEVLERAGRIKTRKAALYRHYYSASITEERHEVILAFLRQETSRDILIHLLELPSGATQTEIIGFTGLSAPTISWHMSRLITSGVVTSSKEGRTVRYALSNSLMNEIATILKTYHPSIWNVLTSRLAELFLELSSAKKDDEP